jgi:hypothetical protein
MKTINIQSIKIKSIIVILNILLVLQLMAQPDSLAKRPQFLYPDFVVSTVQLKSGEIHTVKMNYNTISGKMVFYHDGILMDLNKPEAVDTIFLCMAKFVYQENGFYEVVVNAPIAFFIQHKSSLSSSDNPSAYGIASQTAASTPISKIYDDKTYNLKLPDNFNVIPAPVYWIRMHNIMYKFASERQFLKIFPSKVAELKSFINQNNISLKEKDDLVRLVLYCNTLKM